MLETELNILITGSSGFVGSNLKTHLAEYSVISEFNRGDVIKVCSNAVVHLAGKAHDHKNTFTSEEYYHVNTELTKTIFEDNSSAVIVPAIISLAEIALA